MCTIVQYKRSSGWGHRGPDDGTFRFQRLSPQSSLRPFQMLSRKARENLLLRESSCLNEWNNGYTSIILKDNYETIVSAYFIQPQIIAGNSPK